MEVPNLFVIRVVVRATIGGFEIFWEWEHEMDARSHLTIWGYYGAEMYERWTWSFEPGEMAIVHDYILEYFQKVGIPITDYV